MKKIGKKQIINSILFSLGVCGIDYIIKGTQKSPMLNNDNELKIYYILLFIVLFILCNVVYEKIKKYNVKR
ncbi:hypothetical protein [Peptostreptococcus faecalis]|uniref:hypothetical protein n=1 Tax=Peptostreptococcus faecalis TaxID=2045015 RepID=UPI000C7C6886|nr:hypothetical protein [Peptostreptococcus faecalis]